MGDVNVIEITVDDLDTTLATLAKVEELLTKARKAIADAPEKPRQIRLNPQTLETIRACRRVIMLLD